MVSRLVRPALGFMAFPLGNALVLQGPLLIIGATLGSADVAMFSALRTLARIPMQLTNMLNASIWPELSRAHGAGNVPLLRHLHRLGWAANLVSVSTLGLAQLLLGRWVMQVWIGNAAHFDPWVYAALVLMTALTALWGASSVVLVATNLHLRLGAVYVLLNAISLAVASLLAPHWQWRGLLLPLLLTEIVLMGWILPRALRVAQDTVGTFFSALGPVVLDSLARLCRRGH
jgi:O-antigen/teichoic acid export membrane protein